MKLNLCWIVATRTGDGEHVFREFDLALAYLRSHANKACGIYAIDTSNGETVLSAELVECTPHLRTSKK